MMKMMNELKQDMSLLRQVWKQELYQEISTLRQEVQIAIQNVETQLAQVITTILERPWGTLPNTTGNSPRETVNAIYTNTK